MSLREKVVGRELDLSLNQLTEVPVKELVAAFKATHLDISCNRIQTLPREFATLTHLVKIDLSNNNLSELPDNFGNLHNLQFLDLYSNQLVNLPVSFCRFKNLRWLDLKNNPLEPKLKAVAGDCLDEKECQSCAKKVVAYMQAMDSDMEREKQKKLKVTREKEAIERAKIEKELEEQRKLKKIEREKRKAESKAKREAQFLLKVEQDDEMSSRLNEERNNREGADQRTSSGEGYCGQIVKGIFVLIASLLFLYYIWSIPAESFNSFDFKVGAQHTFLKMKSHAFQALKGIQYYLPIAKESVMRIVHHYMVLITHYASQIEQILSFYF